MRMDENVLKAAEHLENVAENKDEQIKIDAFDKKIIYVYEHIDVESHKGWVKVGETTAHRITGEGENMRILEQHTAANIQYRVLYTTDAITNSGYIFSDHDIHELLEGMDIEREDSINPNTNKKSEWFKTSPEVVIEAIEKYKMEAIEDKKGIITSFTLRKEQNEAIEKTKEYYEHCQNDINVEPAFLWNAKPRFGKTLTAYSFASSIQAKKVLIVTNRPAIADSWYTDFKKFDFKAEGQNDGKFRWIFTSSEAVRNHLGNPKDIFTRDEQTLNPNLLTKNMVHFISLQDIKGLTKDEDSTKSFKEKNKWIFENDPGTGYGWDLVIIDESHEGTDTKKAFNVFDNMNTKFTLHLSGTPFKALASNKFNSTQIYNWSYTDEQNAKEEWYSEDGPNPYADLPKMNIFTYRLSRILETTAEEAKSEGSEYAFDLSEFFRVVKEGGEDRFAYEDKVKLFIENLHNPMYQYPFSSDNYRNNLRHTFWLLPGVKACEQMKKLLLEDEWFKENYSPEDIIMAAGNGDEDRLTKTALEEVRRRIGKPSTNRHPLETRTITLSCGQLTTGVTVEAWTAVLMLNNCKSPALYMQSAFRAQNPFKIATSGGEVVTKNNCFVFDFAPDRILQTLAEMADNGGTGGGTRVEKVRILTNFLPVIAEDDEGKMKYLDADEILAIPLKLITEEVVNRGFMSNRLFENIGNIFGCPQDIKDIIAKMDEADGKDVKKKDKKTVKPQVKVWVDPENKIHINEDIVVATTNGLLGDKKYVEIGSDEGKEVEETIGEAVSQARANGHSAEAIKAIKSALTKKMPKLVVKIPDPAPKPGDPDYIEKEKPDEKPKKNEKSDEDIIRDRLRGFARTIPSFLMAYGNTDTKLSNFSDNIPDDVFKELTNITKEEFDKLRFGMDYETTNEKGEKVTAHFDRLINEDVFNSSVQEFCEKRKELSLYYHSNSEEDIFEYIPPQSNNQIFTPKRVVRMMVDMLEKENPGIFNSTTNTFIDLYMKSGMYITEIVKRIFQNTRDEYPSDTTCIKHILEEQVYGFAPSPILDAITKNYIFGFDPEEFIDRKNFVQLDTIPSAKAGTLQETINTAFSKEGGNMKFTAIVGNPPYQETIEGRGDAPSVYNYFMDNSYKISDKVCLITPGRFLFNVGNTPSRWNLKMLNDPHFKILLFEQLSKNIFANTDIKGGVAISYHDNNKTFGSIGTFTHYNELNGILKKVAPTITKSLSDIYYSTDSYHFTEELHVEHPNAKQYMSSGHEYDIKSSIFNRFCDINIFTDKKQADDDIEIIGLVDLKRTSKYIKNKYIKEHPNLNYYKVILPGANGSGAIGEVLSTPLIGKPLIGHTQTFVSFGAYDNIIEAENLLKYIKTKFARTLLGVLKITQSNKRNTWKYVPLQDFTNKSDIDWSKSIPEIDKQLYKKYNLSEDEINFIEEKVQPME